MTSDHLERMQGWQCPTNLWPRYRPFLHVLVTPYLDDGGHACGQRINGCATCPDCGLELPLIEEPEAWRASPFRVTEWGLGTAWCPDCGTVVVDTFDGAMAIRPGDF